MFVQDSCSKPSGWGLSHVHESPLLPKPERRGSSSICANDQTGAKIVAKQDCVHICSCCIEVRSSACTLSRSVAGHACVAACECIRWSPHRQGQLIEVKDLTEALVS
jgi:hypothetical protein